MRLIDADALKGVMIETLERIKANPKMDKQEMHILAAFHAVGEMVDDAPTMDSELVRHGEWVKMHGMMPPEYMGLKECSVCGWHIHPLGRTAFDLKESEFRYCPRCGARLDRERKEDATN